MHNPEKRKWTKPVLKAFSTPEDLWAHYSSRDKADEFPRLIDLIDRMRAARPLDTDEAVPRKRRA